MTDDNYPCATCVRWSECNGVDAERCPLEEIDPVTVQDVTDNNVRSKEWGDGFKQGYEDGYKVGFDADKWISVKERLPDKTGLVLGYGIGLGVLLVYYEVGVIRSGWQSITHWMPLPEPPKGE